MTSPTKSPFVTIVARIARTISVFADRQRPAHVDQPRDDERQAEEHQHAAHDHPRDQPDDGSRRTRRPRAGRARPPSPALRPSTAICCASDVRLSAWYPGIPPKRLDTTFTTPRVAELLVRVEVGVEQQLDPTHVEQARDHGDEHRGGDAGGLTEHRRPVRAGDRVDGPRLPQPRGRERSEQPEPVPRGVDGRAGARASRSRRGQARSRPSPGSRAAAAPRGSPPAR